MSEGEVTLDNARRRYLLSEAGEDLNEALGREDYNAAKTYAQCMYDTLFELCGHQTGDGKKAEQSRLKELSDLIDSINEKLSFGGKEKRISSKST